MNRSSFSGSKRIPVAELITAVLFSSEIPVKTASSDVRLRASTFALMAGDAMSAMLGISEKLDVAKPSVLTSALTDLAAAVRFKREDSSLLLWLVEVLELDSFALVEPVFFDDENEVDDLLLSERPLRVEEAAATSSRERNFFFIFSDLLFPLLDDDEEGKEVRETTED
jgi:hypothetical protein